MLGTDLCWEYSWENAISSPQERVVQGADGEPGTKEGRPEMKTTRRVGVECGQVQHKARWSCPDGRQGSETRRHDEIVLQTI